MGSGSADRRKRDVIAAVNATEPGMFDDLAPEDEGVSPDAYTFVGVRFSELHLLLLLESDATHIVPGIEVRFKKNGGRGRILAFNKIEYGGEVFASLSTACLRSFKDVVETAHRKTADGWEQTVVPRPGVVGVTDTMNRLVREFWQSFNIPYDILVDNKALAELLFSQGKIDRATYERNTHQGRKTPKGKN